jgi:hypothetical protein
MRPSYLGEFGRCLKRQEIGWTSSSKPQAWILDLIFASGIGASLIYEALICAASISRARI